MAAEFHIWRMDWDSEAISLFVDGMLLNKTLLSDLKNDDGSDFHPFKQQHTFCSIWQGGMKGGLLNDTKFPDRMEVDYVRVYQK